MHEKKYEEWETEVKNKEKVEGKGGGRQVFRHVDGDVSLCMRTKEDARESKQRLEEKGSSSSNQTKGEGSSKKTMRRKETESEGKNPCGSSTEKKEALRETTEEQDVTFVVQQKNVTSLNSSHRVEDLIRELEGCKWDALLISASWRPEKAEIWETRQGHLYMEAGKFESKHGVGILLNKKMRRRVNWTDFISERAIAASITVNKQLVLLMSVYFPHSGYADHHVEKAYRAIEKHTNSNTGCCSDLDIFVSN